MDVTCAVISPAIIVPESKQVRIADARGRGRRVFRVELERVDGRVEVGWGLGVRKGKGRGVAIGRSFVVWSGVKWSGLNENGGGRWTGVGCGFFWGKI